MAFFADRFVALLDANVLYPVRKRDVLLRFFEAGFFRARWSERILDEWARNVIKKRPDLADKIHEHRALLKSQFPDALVSGFERLEQGLRLPDPHDRHVLAAAIRCGAQHIVTDNLRDFPDVALADHDVTPIEADAFLTSAFELYEIEAVNTLRALRRDYRNPPLTASAFRDDLADKGLPKLAAALEPHTERL